MDTAWKNKTLSIAAFTEAKELICDLSSYKLSENGRKAVIDRLVNVAEEHSKELNEIMTYVNDLIVVCQKYEDKISQPQKLEKEFEDVAKKLNFPIVPAIDDAGSKNPNIETSFEDPIPDNDVNFIKERLDEHPEDKVVLSKEDDPLPDKYFNTFLHIDKKIYGNKTSTNVKPSSVEESTKKPRLPRKKSSKKKNR